MPIILNPNPPAPTVIPPTGPPEPLESAADRLYRRLAPLAVEDAENGFALQGLCAALMDPAQIVDNIARDTLTHEAWTQIADPDAAPSWVLPWLAQWDGTTLLPSDTEQQQRDRIRQAAGFYRGTDRAVSEEVALTLTSGDPNMVRVVHPSRWEMTVLSRFSDTPDGDVSERAALAQKPVGVQLTYVVSNAPIIDEFTRTIDAITATIDSLTLADVT